MPNTLTNVKDIKVAQTALQPWMAGLLPLRAFSTNFPPDPANKLDTVRVPVVGAPSASSEFAGSYTAEEAEGTSGGRWPGEPTPIRPSRSSRCSSPSTSSRPST